MVENSNKILVAEDDNFLRKVYETKLTQEGFNVDVAVDGEEALKKIEKSTPAILLLDLVMPKVNGFDVLAELKKSGKLDEFPVVVLSNLGQTEDIQRCRELGAKDYLVKANFSINDVVSKIRNYIEESVSAKKTRDSDSSDKKQNKKTVKDKTKKCTNCGKSVPVGSKFCPYCGEEFSEKVSVEVKS